MGAWFSEANQHCPCVDCFTDDTLCSEKTPSALWSLIPTDPHLRLWICPSPPLRAGLRCNTDCVLSFFRTVLLHAHFAHNRSHLITGLELSVNQQNHLCCLVSLRFGLGICAKMSKTISAPYIYLIEQKPGGSLTHQFMLR